MRIIFLPAILFFAFSSCRTTDKAASKNVRTDDLMEKASVSWTGKLPCADCPGIDYQLVLNKDGSFTETSVYQERQVKPFIENGNWNISPDSVIQLRYKGHENRYFAFRGRYLEMLDLQGKEIQSDFREKYRLEPKPENQNTGEEPEAAFWNEKSVRGIDFFASGNEPFWSLEIDFEENLALRLMGEEEISVPAPEQDKTPGAPEVHYRKTINNGLLKIIISRKNCVDNMSGEKRDYEVKIRMEKKGEKVRELSGCGRYIADARLHDVYVLEKFEGKTLRAGDFPRGVPDIDLQPGAGKVFGFGGCNRFFGELSAGNRSLRFEKIGSTLMACDGVDIETRFFRALSEKELPYRLENGKLYLGTGKNEMVFRKVD